MENRSHALVAGIFVILFGCAAALALWWLGQSDDSVDEYVLVTRKNVTGLNVQATVRYRGIRAGKVRSIGTDPEDPRVIQVRIVLDSRFKLTRGTTAQLGYQGVTGLAYVQIEDDGSSAELLKVGADGTVPRIELKPTLFDTLGEKAVDIVAQVGAVTARLAVILDEKNVRNIARTLENAATTSEGMKELPAVVAALREALSAANLKRLQEILAKLEKAAGETAPLTAEMRQLVRSSTELAKKVDAIAGETGDELTTATLPRANALLHEVTASSRQLNQLLENIGNNPQMLIFGREGDKPGPGEAGFVAPVAPAN